MKNVLIYYKLVNLERKLFNNQREISFYGQ